MTKYVCAILVFCAVFLTAGQAQARGRIAGRVAQVASRPIFHPVRFLANRDYPVLRRAANRPMFQRQPMRRMFGGGCAGGRYR